MTSKKSLLATGLVLLGCLSTAGVAHGFVKSITFAPISPGTIVIDGSSDDWYDAGYPCIDIGDDAVIWGEKSLSDEDDYSLVACFATDDENIYIALDVLDDRQVRTKKPTTDEDHVEFWIEQPSEDGVERTVVRFFPERKFPTFHPALRRIAADGEKMKPIKGAKFSMESHSDGWIAEIVLPMGAFPGLREALVASSWALVAYDSDTKGESPVVETILATRGVAEVDVFEEDSVHTLPIVMEKVQGVIEAFAKNQGATASSLDLKYADLAEDSRLEVLVQAIPVIGILGPGFMSSASYTYVMLPTDSASDVHLIETRDVTGDGKDELIVKYTERNDLGQRKMLAVYSFLASELRKVLVQELEVSVGSKSITCSAKFVSNGPGGSEMLLVEPGSAKGWSEVTYKNVPEYGVGSVLTPWGGEQRRLWVVQGLDFKMAEEGKIDALLEAAEQDPKKKDKKKKKKKK